MELFQASTLNIGYTSVQLTNFANSTTGKVHLKLATCQLVLLCSVQVS